MYFLAVTIKTESTKCENSWDQCNFFFWGASWNYVQYFQCPTCCQVLCNSSSRSKWTMLDGDLKTVKGSSIQLFALSDFPRMRSGRCWTKSLPWILFPTVQARFIHGVAFFWVHSHSSHVEKKKGGGGVKPEQTVLLSDKSESWKHKWIRKTNQYKSTSTESMENN